MEQEATHAELVASRRPGCRPAGPPRFHPRRRHCARIGRRRRDDGCGQEEREVWAVGHLHDLGPDPTTGVSLGVGVSDSYENTGPLICPDGNPADGGFCTLATLAPGASVTASYVAIARNTCCPEDLGVAVASVNSETIDASDPVSSNNESRVETPFKGKPRS